MSRAQFLLGQELAYELSLKVKTKTEHHWDKKIQDGIIPAELKKRGPVDPEGHAIHRRKFCRFEPRLVRELFEGQWKTTGDSVGVIHYFGIGTGESLAEVVPIANANNHKVIAYDTSSVGYHIGGDVMHDNRDNGFGNEVYLADMTFACRAKYIQPEIGTKIVASRVLGILDKQEKNWKQKDPAKRKMARTLQTIGKLLPFPDVMLIHRCPEDNPTAVWGDSTPHSLEEIKSYMEEGAGAKLDMTLLGTEMYYDQLHRGVLIRP